MTHCDALADDQDVVKLENDEDVGPVLEGDEEYQRVVKELEQAEADLLNKKANVDVIQYHEQRKLVASHPKQDTDEHGML